MPSFFTVPGAQTKRKRPAASEGPRKKFTATKPSNGRTQAQPNNPASKGQARDESISGSDEEKSAEEDDGQDGEDLTGSEPESDDEGQTAAERRLKLAERYLDNLRQEVDPNGFDAEEIDRDLIAERLKEDVAESKGKSYRKLVSELAFDKAIHTFFRSDTQSTTAVATCAPYVYTASKDLHLIKWRLQDLPGHQFPQTTKKKPKKPPAPPRRQPDRVRVYRGRRDKAGDKTFQGHTAAILTVAASADGKYVVTGGQDRRLIVWDAATLRPLRVFTQHRGAVTGLALRRGPSARNELYSCSGDRTVKVWSLDELAYVDTLFGHGAEVMDVDALALERCVSVGGMDRTARLWKVVEESQLVFRSPGADGKAVKKARAAAAAAGAPTAARDEASVDRVAMIDEELFVTGSDNGSLSLWSTQKKKPLHVLPLAHGIDPPLPPHRTSGERIETGPEGGAGEQPFVPTPQPRWITALRTVPYSDVVLSGSWDGVLRVWKLSDDKRRLEPGGVLGLTPSSSSNAAEEKEANQPNGQSPQANGIIKGFVNDISVFERGDRGLDGLCVVAAVGKEMRMSRVKKIASGGRNGAIVFEIPRVQLVELHNGNHREG